MRDLSNDAKNAQFEEAVQDLHRCAETKFHLLLSHSLIDIMMISRLVDVCKDMQQLRHFSFVRRALSKDKHADVIKRSRSALRDALAVFQVCSIRSFVVCSS